MVTVSFGGGGGVQGVKVAVVRMSLASIQSPVQNVMLFAHHDLLLANFRPSYVVTLGFCVCNSNIASKVGHRFEYASWHPGIGSALFLFYRTHSEVRFIAS